MMKTIFSLLILLSTLAQASIKKVCGDTDDRVPHKDMRIGRVGRTNGCTATLISANCAISAGHCAQHFTQIEFDVPDSIQGVTQAADARDTYDIIPTSISYFYARANDWAVFKIKPNAITKLLPGRANGFYKVNFQTQTPGIDVTISGYGTDMKGSGELNFTLQTHHNTLTGIKSHLFGPVLSYFIDSTGGTSGSAIVRTKEQDIIGVHTNSGCPSIENFGTSIANTPAFQEAIKACLK